MVYVVSYDLRKPGKDYIGLTEQLQASPGWWHYLASTWLISTSESATQLYNRLVPHLDKDDSILIIEAGNHEVKFNSENLSQGEYYYEIEAFGKSLTKKMIILK